MISLNPGQYVLITTNVTVRDLNISGYGQVRLLQGVTLTVQNHFQFDGGSIRSVNSTNLLAPSASNLYPVVVSSTAAVFATEQRKFLQAVVMRMKGQWTWTAGDVVMSNATIATTSTSSAYFSTGSGSSSLAMEINNAWQYYDTTPNAVLNAGVDLHYTVGADGSALNAVSSLVAVGDVFSGDGAHAARTADVFPLYVGSDQRAMWYYGRHVNGTGYAGAMYDHRALVTTQYTVADVDQCAALCATGIYASWCVSFDYQAQTLRCALSAFTSASVGGLTTADSPMWSHYEPRIAKGARFVDSYLQVAGKLTVRGLGQVQIGPITAFLSGSSLTATTGATVSFQHGVYTAPRFQGLLCSGSTLSFNSSSPDQTAPGLTLVSGATLDSSSCVSGAMTGVLRFQRGRHQLLGQLVGTHSLQSLDNASVTVFLNASSSSALAVNFQQIDVADHSTVMISSSLPVGSASNHFVMLTADTVVVESGGTLFVNTATMLTATTLLNVSSTGVISAAGAGYPGASGPGAGLRGLTGGSGGSHGGRGGSALVDSASIIGYGDTASPIAPGSGGGNGYDITGHNGGSGGGVLKIVALTSFKLNGVVTCEGMPGIGAGSGGGAGGSLQIYAAILSGNGTIRASGGTGNFVGGQMSGGGR